MKFGCLGSVVGVILAGIMAALPTSALAERSPNIVSGPAACNNDHRTVEPFLIEEFYTTIAICGSRARVGSEKFNSYWQEVFEICAQGKTPTALWETLTASNFVFGAMVHRPSCEQIAAIVELFDVPVADNNMDERRTAAIQSENEAIQILRDNAAGGSPGASFILAWHLLTLEPITELYVPKHVDEAISILGQLARSGQAEQVVRVAQELEKGSTGPGTNLHWTILNIYAELANANDPRGHLRLAEEALWRAQIDAKMGREFTFRELDLAEEHLELGIPFATGALKTHMTTLKQKIAVQRNAPTGGHLIISAIVAGYVFGDNWKQKGLETAIDITEECYRNKPAVDLDPTLRLPYSLLGCIPY